MSVLALDFVVFPKSKVPRREIVLGNHRQRQVYEATSASGQITTFGDQHESIEDGMSKMRQGVLARGQGYVIGSRRANLLQ